ncbi:MAG: acetoacetate decarboxylase family protein [Gallionella sp.]|nr:acetoacetate decarboxylase family protein [Gallionella sp.]MDD4947467.1 acetoacetate decarboxylase family protein [Gallionella sp.]MDD5611518.1 acetoacetate decarboxylase family protein [Gallionella sp.]
MAIPERQHRIAGRRARIDGIPYVMPVNSDQSPVLTAAFSIDLEAARRLMPCNELHPFQLWRRGVLVVTAVDCRNTDTGNYIEFSIAIACTHGASPAPRLLPGLFAKTFGTGQYIWDIPVSSEAAAKGGRGIWGMPKHQANLDFVIGEQWVSSQYDLDGQMMMRIDVAKPESVWLPLQMGAANYCAFRGMLVKSYPYFKGRMGFSLFKPGAARLFIGNHPRMAPLKSLGIDPVPILAGYLPASDGVLDDHVESWFITGAGLPAADVAGLEAVVPLGQSQQWLAPPTRANDWEAGA